METTHVYRSGRQITVEITTPISPIELQGYMIDEVMKSTRTFADEQTTFYYGITLNGEIILINSVKYEAILAADKNA